MMLCILPGQETYWRYPLHQRSTHWNVTVSKPAAVSFDCRWSVHYYNWCSICMLNQNTESGWV